MLRTLVVLNALTIIASAGGEQTDHGRLVTTVSVEPRDDANRCDGDGAVGASPSMPQHPELLKPYALRSPCKVAGVDYAVGPTSTPLKDPATISMAGISVAPSTRTVTISGNNITLDGYDFSLHGGYQMVVEGANTTISNSNFMAGTNTGLNQIRAS